MSYTESTVFLSAHTSPWLRVDLFLQALREMNRQNFSIAANRTAAETQYNNATANLADPFGRNRRFQANRLFVNMMASDWPAKEQSLRMALAYKDAVNTGGSQSQQQQQQQQAALANNGLLVRAPTNLSDATAGYYNTIRSMISQLGNREGVDTRQTFESRFEWNATAQNIFNVAQLRNTAVAIFSAPTIRIGNNAARAQNQAWPTLANTVPINDATFDLADGTVHLWSESRTANHRARLDFNIAGGVATPVAFLVVASAD